MDDERLRAPQPAPRRGPGPQWPEHAPHRCGRRRRRDATAVATEPYDEWDDDLDWGGETAVAAPPVAPPAPAGPESDLDWQMPGQNGNGNGNGAVAEPDEETVWDDWADAEEPANGNGAVADVPPAPVEEDVTFTPVNGAAAAPEADPPSRATPHEEARTDAPGTEDDAPLAEPDWDWEPVVSRPETAAATAAVASAPAEPGRLGRARTAGRKANPLVLVALYALFGIGVIVIAVNVDQRRHVRPRHRPHAAHVRDRRADRDADPARRDATPRTPPRPSAWPRPSPTSASPCSPRSPAPLAPPGPRNAAPAPPAARPAPPAARPPRAAPVATPRPGPLPWRPRRRPRP